MWALEEVRFFFLKMCSFSSLLRVKSNREQLAPPPPLAYFFTQKHSIEGILFIIVQKNIKMFSGWTQPPIAQGQGLYVMPQGI